MNSSDVHILVISCILFIEEKLRYSNVKTYKYGREVLFKKKNSVNQMLRHTSMEGICFLKFSCHFHYLKNNNYFEIDALKTSWKRVKISTVRYVSIHFPCKGSNWNIPVDCLLFGNP